MEKSPRKMFPKLTLKIEKEQKLLNVFLQVQCKARFQKQTDSRKEENSKSISVKNTNANILN